MGDDETVQTERVLLVPFRPEQILALIEKPDAFEGLSGYRAAAGLREFYTSGEVSAEFLANLRTLKKADPWRLGFGAVDPETRSVIGVGGFKGSPREGIVEIAYGIVPAFEGAGYATEVARALVAYAQRDPSVTSIIAHTLPSNNASTKVLAKCGFRFVGEVDDPDDGRVWRWQFAPMAP